MLSKMCQKAVDAEGGLIMATRERERGQTLELGFGKPGVWLSLGRFMFTGSCSVTGPMLVVDLELSWQPTPLPHFIDDGTETHRGT